MCEHEQIIDKSLGLADRLNNHNIQSDIGTTMHTSSHGVHQHEHGEFHRDTLKELTLPIEVSVLNHANSNCDSVNHILDGRCISRYEQVVKDLVAMKKCCTRLKV